MIELLESCDLTNYSVIIPSVSVGNVGQLTVDLLISSLKCKKLGYLWHQSVLTFAGSDPFGNSNGVSTGCELFYSEPLKLVVFQIRSAFVQSKSNFLEEICKWLLDNHIKQVIILTGVSAHERRDEQLIGEPLRYVFCPLTKREELENAKRRNWRELENIEINSDASFISMKYIPGGGITVKLFQKLAQEKIPCSILLEFCSDGNNLPDALKLANYLDEWFMLKEKSKIDNWVIPPSWNLLFGPLPPIEIFN